MKEQWKPVVGFESELIVSNLGNVRAQGSLKPSGMYALEKQVTVHTHHSGYCYILHYVNGKQKFLLLHRLVAEAFIPNYNNLPEVNHKDLDKGNCKVSNLEWCSRAYNMEHASKNGAFKTAKDTTDTIDNKPATNYRRPVVRVSPSGERVEFPSVNACARSINGFSTNVSSCLNGKMKSYKGYTFERV